ncbi:MAG: cyclic nucleotide-binding domain-containing protein, partial [Pseudomonadota bacterium]|nr:cyclic nucleotide-binding domain-containing protein [Pseudomonadota bacterium]
MELTLVDVIGHLAFLLTAISFYLKDILLLRFLAIVSSIVGIGYNYFLDEGPLWLPIFWLGVFTAINVWRIVGILMERSAIHFSDDERELYETIFKGFAPVEFMKLMRIAEWRDADQGAVFATEGRPVDGLRLLFSGEVNVERDGREIGSARDGALVGEMSFIQGGDASATVTTTVPCRYIF